MKRTRVVTAWLIGIGLLSGCLSSAEAKLPIQGTEQLQADLTNNGHLERVELVQYVAPGTNNLRGPDVVPWTLAQIVVRDDQNKIIWSGPKVDFYSSDHQKDKTIMSLHYGTQYILLHDIDGDGNLELCTDTSGATLGEYVVLRWKDGKFIPIDDKSSTYNYRLPRTDSSEFQRNPDPKSCQEAAYGYLVLLGLRKSQGRLIGEYRNPADQTKKKVELETTPQGNLHIKNVIQVFPASEMW